MLSRVDTVRRGTWECERCADACDAARVRVGGGGDMVGAALRGLVVPWQLAVPSGGPRIDLVGIASVDCTTVTAWVLLP